MHATLDEVYAQAPGLRGVVAAIRGAGAGLSITLDALRELSPGEFTVTPYAWYHNPSNIAGGHARRGSDETILADRVGAVRYLGRSCPALHGLALREIAPEAFQGLARQAVRNP